MRDERLIRMTSLSGLMYKEVYFAGRKLFFGYEKLSSSPALPPGMEFVESASGEKPLPRGMEFVEVDSNQSAQAKNRSLEGVVA